MIELKLTDRDWRILQNAVYIVRDMQEKSALADRQKHPNFIGKLASEINLQHIENLAKIMEV